MTLDTEEVTLEPAEETATQDVTVETIDADTEETESNDSPDVEEAVERTVEQKLEEATRAKAGMQKKIDRQTAANRATQEKYDAQRQEMEKLSQSIAQQKPDVEPSIDDFETHEEYSKARDEFIRKDAVATAQNEFLAQQKQVQRQQLDTERDNLRQTQEAEYLTEHPKYKNSANEVNAYINSLADVSLETVDAFAEQLYDGNVPSVIDYFGANNGENLDELGKISRMSPPQAAVAVYKLQQKLSGTPTTKKQNKPVSAPAKRPKGGGKPIKDLHSGSVLKNLGLKA